MRIFSIFLAVTVLITSAAAQVPFKAYTSPDAKFTISFPGAPNVSPPLPQQTDQGRTFTEQHFAVADDGAYIVMTADYPFITDNTTLSGMAKEQAASCGAPPAHILSNKNRQGRPALLFTVDCPKNTDRDGISLIVQAVADGKRLYRIMYGTSDKADKNRVSTFLLSFRIN